MQVQLCGFTHMEWSRARRVSALSTVLFQTIQFSISTQFKCQKQFYFKQFRLALVLSLLLYYQPQRVPVTAWTALITWYMYCELAHTKNIAKLLSHSSICSRPQKTFFFIIKAWNLHVVSWTSSEWKGVQNGEKTYLFFAILSCAFTFQSQGEMTSFTRW